MGERQTALEETLKALGGMPYAPPDRATSPYATELDILVSMNYKLDRLTNLLEQIIYAVESISHKMVVR
jgi:hypothetical protein